MAQGHLLVMIATSVQLQVIKQQPTSQAIGSNDAGALMTDSDSYKSAAANYAIGSNGAAWGPG